MWWCEIIHSITRHSPNAGPIKARPLSISATIRPHLDPRGFLAQFSLYVHKGGLKPDSFHFFGVRFSLQSLWSILSHSQSEMMAQRWVNAGPTSQHCSIVVPSLYVTQRWHSLPSHRIHTPSVNDVTKCDTSKLCPAGFKCLWLMAMMLSILPAGDTQPLEAANSSGSEWLIECVLKVLDGVFEMKMW